MSEFIKQFAAEWAAAWNRNYAAVGGIDPKMVFAPKLCVYRERWHRDRLREMWDRRGYEGENHD